MKKEEIGKWSFMGGLVIAILLGLASQLLVGYTSYLNLLLVVLGIIVGLLHVKQKQAQSFLLASVSLLVAGAAGLQTIPAVGTYVSNVITNVVAFVAPAAVIVALKTIYDIGK